jgi:ribosomal protein L29
MAKVKKERTNEVLRQLGAAELNDKLTLARKALFDLKFKKTEQKNPLKVRWARREVARILTIMQEKSGGSVEKIK